MEARRQRVGELAGASRLASRLPVVELHRALVVDHRLVEGESLEGDVTRMVRPGNRGLPLRQRQRRREMARQLARVTVEVAAVVRLDRLSDAVVKLACAILRDAGAHRLVHQRVSEAPPQVLRVGNHQTRPDRAVERLGHLLPAPPSGLRHHRRLEPRARHRRRL